MMNFLYQRRRTCPTIVLTREEKARLRKPWKRDYSLVHFSLLSVFASRGMDLSARCLLAYQFILLTKTGM